MLDRWTCPFLKLNASSWHLSSPAVICPCWMYNHRGSASTTNRCGEQNQHLRRQYSSRAGASVTKERLRKGASSPGMVQKSAKVSSFPHGILSDWNKKHRAKVSRVPKGGRSFRIHLPWTQKHCCWNLQSSQPTDPYLYWKSSSTKIYIMWYFVLPRSPVRRNKMPCPCFLQWAVNTLLIQPFDNGILAAPETGKSVLVTSRCDLTLWPHTVPQVREGRCPTQQAVNLVELCRPSRKYRRDSSS